MTYANERAGRVVDELSEFGRGDFWTYDAVEERLIEAMRLWRRSPGGGKWPFAGDAPWQWMTRATRVEASGLKGMDVKRMLQEMDEAETKRLEGREHQGALTRDEVALRDETTEWLAWVTTNARKVVIEALKQRLAGRANIDWRIVRRAIGSEVTRQGLYKRYTTAISAIVKCLNGEPPQHAS